MILFLSLSRERKTRRFDPRIDFVGAKQIFSHLSGTKLILSSSTSIDNLSLSLFLEWMEAYARISRGGQDANSNDNGDGSRYLFASDAKNYTVAKKR